MKRLHTNQICTMTELREPQKVFDQAGGKPVAIMKNSKCIGYLVPEDATLQDAPRYATMDEVMNSVQTRRDANQAVLDYLKDK
jgi:antitoxin StbD